MTYKNELDLHGVKHEDVERLVENFVLLNEPPITIICGNSDKMIGIVRDKLDELYDTQGIGWQLWNHNTFKIL